MKRLKEREEQAQDGRVCVDAAHYQVCQALMDSLLHDVRNPLNALSINLDVVHEKIKRGGSPELTQATQKNVVAMREQIKRVDLVLRGFAEFLAPGREAASEAPFSELVTRAVELASYEARRSQVRIRPLIEPGVTLPERESASARLLALLPVLRAVRRAEPGSEITVTLSQTPKAITLHVMDGRGGAEEPLRDGPDAVGVLAARYGGHVHFDAAECTVILPRGAENEEGVHP